MPGFRFTVEHLIFTMVVSAMEPKLLMKMLQETLTGGPGEQDKKQSCG